MSEVFLEARELHKSFYQGGQEIQVLKGLALAMKEGESVAVVGRSGSGKSTFLSLLSGLDRPDRGDLIYKNTSYNELKEEELTLFRGQHMGIIFQQFHLLPHLTAWENVSLALEILGHERAREEALEALEKVGLGHRRDHLPLKLSGGERQRVAIARAIAPKPSLLLADEPSGSLDEKTGEEVMGLIFELVAKEKMGLLLVTHDTELAQRCDRQLLLDDGQLKELNS